MPPEVMDALGPWGQFGILVTMVGLVVTSLVRGWLRPVSSVDREIKHLEARLSDRDDTIKELKEANVLLRKTNDTLATAVKESLEIGRTSNAALTSLPRVGVEQ